MSNPTKWTPERGAAAVAMLARGASLIDISRAMGGITYKTLKCWTDPDYHRRHCDQRNARNSGKSAYHPTCYVNTLVRPRKEEIAARLREIPPDTRTPGQIICGEPIPGRSALDRKLQGVRS